MKNSKGELNTSSQPCFIDCECTTGYNILPAGSVSPILWQQRNTTSRVKFSHGLWWKKNLFINSAASFDQWLRVQRDWLTFA